MINTGVVTKSTGSWYYVKTKTEAFSCKLKGKFRLHGIKSTNPIAVGDIVEFTINAEDNTGVIYKINDRKNYIIRKSTNLSKQAHILASNIDYAFLVATIKQPKTYTEFIDRFLVTCEANNIEGAIIFNKIDIYNEEDNEQVSQLMDLYQNIGYKCIKISVEDEININEIENLIEDKIIVISGNSGVGKSSLINLLQPGLNLKTNEVSDSSQKGKHTTTFAEMHPIGNGYIIDTPGIKGFGLIDIETVKLSHYFPEMNSIRDKCKFNDCTHTHEPGCAVKTALENNEISMQRYKNYLSMLEDGDSPYRLDIFK